MDFNGFTIYDKYEPQKCKKTSKTTLKNHQKSMIYFQTVHGNQHIGENIPKSVFKSHEFSLQKIHTKPSKEHKKKHTKN